MVYLVFLAVYLAEFSWYAWTGADDMDAANVTALFHGFLAGAAYFIPAQTVASRAERREMRRELKEQLDAQLHEKYPDVFGKDPPKTFSDLKSKSPYP